MVILMPFILMDVFTWPKRITSGLQKNYFLVTRRSPTVCARLIIFWVWLGLEPMIPGKPQIAFAKAKELNPVWLEPRIALARHLPRRRRLQSGFGRKRTDLAGPAAQR